MRRFIGILALTTACAPSGEPEHVAETHQALAWNQVVKLTSSTPDADAWFGASVAVDGQLVVVGAPLEDSKRGAVHVFARDQGGTNAWGEVEVIHAANGQAFNEFGRTVAISGDTVLVGAPGASTAGIGYIFQRDQGGPDAWGFVKQLAPPGGARIGLAVALDGDTAVIGGGTYTTSGRAHVFARNQGGTDAWGYVTSLEVPSGLATFFGTALDVDGDRIIVGANGSEAAYIYERNEGGTDTWGLVATLTAEVQDSNDDFGMSVAIDGDTALVGASHHLTNNIAAGSLHIYQRDQGGPGAWGEVIEVKSADGLSGLGYELGLSAALVGDRAIAGATSSDAFYVFERNAGGIDAWGEVDEISGDDTNPADRFARAVAYDGTYVVSGATFVDAGATHAGAAYIHALLGESGDPCSDPNECISGQCVSGYCCDAPCNGATDSGIGGGSAGSAGTTNTGGSGANGTGGAGGGTSTGGNPSNATPSSDSEGGCGCELPPNRNRARSALIVAVGAALLLLGRQRRRSA